MKNEERQMNGDVSDRSSWCLRNLIPLLVFATGIASHFVFTWHTSMTALALAEDNKATLAKNRDNVASVPHIKETMEKHFQDFRDYKRDQTIVNLKVLDTLNQIRNQQLVNERRIQ